MHLHWIDSPNDESEATDGRKEVADLATSVHSRSTPSDKELPDHNEVRNTSDGIPSPLLGSFLRAKGSKKTSQNHNDIGNDSDEDAAAVHAGQETQVKEQKRGGERPIDVASPVHFTVDVVLGVWNVVMRFTLDNMVVADAVPACHSEVRAGSEGRDESCDDVEEALGLSRRLVWVQS